MENENLDLFDRFFQHQLSESEKIDFENRLQNDEHFRKSYTEYKTIAEGVEFAAGQSLKHELQKHELKQKRINSPLTLVYKIAAGIIIVAATTYLLFDLNSTSTTTELYAVYYSPYPNIIDPLNRSESNDDKSIFQLYEAKEYAEVIVKIDNASKNDADQFYLGQSYMAIGNIQSAIESLKKVEETSDFFEISQWYLALCYLNSNQTEMLQDRINMLIENNGDYADKARRLSKDL